MLWVRDNTVPTLILKLITLKKNIMKKLTLIPVLALTIGLTFTSCKKEDNGDKAYEYLTCTNDKVDEIQSTNDFYTNKMDRFRAILITQTPNTTQYNSTLEWMDKTQTDWTNRLEEIDSEYDCDKYLK